MSLVHESNPKACLWRMCVCFEYLNLKGDLNHLNSHFSFRSKSHFPLCLHLSGVFNHISLLVEVMPCAAYLMNWVGVDPIAKIEFDSDLLNVACSNWSLHRILPLKIFVLFGLIEGENIGDFDILTH